MLWSVYSFLGGDKKGFIIQVPRFRAVACEARVVGSSGGGGRGDAATSSDLLISLHAQ